MNIQKTLIPLQKKIKQRLEIFFKDKIKEFKKISPLAEQMIKEIRDFVMRGGKRIRPILLYYGYLAAGGKNKKVILDAAISIELIHNYLLIHDDIIDNDKVRRHKPTFHYQYQSIYHQVLKDAHHLGIGAGIIAGDLLSTFGYKLLTQSNFQQSAKIKALDVLNQAMINVEVGQILDVFLGLETRLTEDEILKILEYKTARYSIEGPLFIGAILAEANQKTLKILHQYAIPLGIAFQIQDDILGMFGDENKTGKLVGADIKEGKPNLLIFKAQKQANPKQKKILIEALGNPNLTKMQLEKVKTIIIKTGSLQYSQNLAQKLVAQSKGILKKAHFPKEVKQSLISIADYIIQRER